MVPASPACASLGAAGAELLMLLLHAVDQFLRAEWLAMRSCQFLRGLRHRHHEDQHQVDNQPEAAAEDRQQHECQAHPHDIHAQPGCQAVAYAGPELAVLDAVQAARPPCGGGRRAGSARCSRSGIPGGRDHRSHFLQDPLDLRRVHHSLVLAQYQPALVGNGLLQVREDLGTVRVVRQRAFGLLQVAAQRLVAVLIDLVGVVVQVDRGDLAHVIAPGG